MYVIWIPKHLCQAFGYLSIVSLLIIYEQGIQHTHEVGDEGKKEREREKDGNSSL
jgi:hypothetical protein